MTSWLFDSQPMVEWRLPELRRKGGPEGRSHLFSSPIPQPTEQRFPRDSTVGYRIYRDSCGRESIVAFLDFGPKPRAGAEIVEACWTNGVPLILTFQEPPSWETPYWRETLTSRSIQTADAGRLRWQPLVSWPCTRLDGSIEELSQWLHRGLPFFPAPIVRFEFAEEIPFEGVGETILELAANPLPCGFKLFSLSETHRNRIPHREWAEILKGFQEAPPTEKSENQVIPLYPER